MRRRSMFQGRARALLAMSCLLMACRHPGASRQGTFDGRDCPSPEHWAEAANRLGVNGEVANPRTLKDPFLRDVYEAAVQRARTRSEPTPMRPEDCIPREVAITVYTSGDRAELEAVGMRVVTEVPHPDGSMIFLGMIEVLRLSLLARVPTVRGIRGQGTLATALNDSTRDGQTFMLRGSDPRSCRRDHTGVPRGGGDCLRAEPGPPGVGAAT